jgi:hypothetical protein
LKKRLASERQTYRQTDTARELGKLSDSQCKHRHRCLGNLPGHCKMKPATTLECKAYGDDGSLNPIPTSAVMLLRTYCGFLETGSHMSLLSGSKGFQIL